MSQQKTDSANTSGGLSYLDAGVDIDAGNALIERIKPLAKKTLRPEVLGNLGGFGALFELDLSKFKTPVLVAGTDGVGTKLKLALQLGIHDTVGIDLVAIRMTRLSGQPKDWTRLSKVFLDDMRRQFLIWRSLPQDTMETYRERTLVQLGREEGSLPRRHGSTEAEVPERGEIC